MEKPEIFETVRRLILSMCKTSVYGDSSPIVNPTSGWAANQDERTGRLLPISEVNGPFGWQDGVDRNNYVSIPPFENTRHRYPWICSLRYM